VSLVFVLCFTVYTVLVTPGTSLSNDEPVNVRWRFKKTRYLYLFSDDNS